MLAESGIALQFMLLCLRLVADKLIAYYDLLWAIAVELVHWMTAAGHCNSA